MSSNGRSGGGRPLGSRDLNLVEAVNVLPRPGMPGPSCSGLVGPEKIRFSLDWSYLFPPRGPHDLLPLPSLSLAPPRVGGFASVCIRS